MEFAFVVNCAGGYGEVRVRDTGEVVFTAGSSEWVSLDGIAYPGEGYVHVPAPPRRDVVQLNGATLPPPAGDRQNLLFHYTSGDTALKYILATGQLRLSPYARTNDPRETKEWLFAVRCDKHPLPPGGAISVSADLNEELKRECRVLCFCGETVVPAGQPPLAASTGWARARMWAQYGSEEFEIGGKRERRRSGVVLTFHQEALLKNAVEHLQERGPLYYGAVEYVSANDNRSMFAFMVDYDTWLSLPRERYVAAHLEQHRGSLFFTKHVDWRQESEGRLVLHATTPHDAFLPIQGALMEVAIGDQFPPERVEECRALASSFGAQLSRITWRNGAAFKVPVR